MFQLEVTDMIKIDSKNIKSRQRNRNPQKINRRYKELEILELKSTKTKLKKLIACVPLKQNTCIPWINT